MKNLGKIILFMMLITSSLNASVKAQLLAQDVYAGDTATYTLVISGSDVKKPLLSDICGNDITATSSQTSIKSINGSYSKSYILSYEFTPMKSCKIQSVGVEINGKIEHSNSVEVNVIARKQNLNADFILEFKSSTKELYIGEPFTLTLLLKQKRGAKAVDSKFLAPDFKGFWIKSESKAQRSKDSEFTRTTVVYELAPQRAGKSSIEPAKLKVASRTTPNGWSPLSQQIRWRTYYSNVIELDVKALPQGVSIIGDFDIEASVKKAEVNPNEAVNLTLKIKGSGNFEDMESFKPFISGVNIFDEKVEITQDGLSQKIVFVSDRDFVIAPFELKYFDINTKSIKTILTKDIRVKVRGSSPIQELSIKREDTSEQIKVKEVVVQNNNYFNILFAFILGVVLGVSIMLFKRRVFPKKVKVFDLNDEKVLLVRLLPYKDIDKEVAELIAILENNIYSKEKTPVDKKKLKEILKKYDIS